MRLMMVALMLLVSVCADQAVASEYRLTSSGNASYFSESQKMIYLRTVIAKLKETVKTMGNTSELESLGMPDSEIKRLQSAMKIKTEQLTEEALVLIRAL